MRYQIQYIGRRSYLAGARAGLDIEDHKWRVAQGETVIGTEAQADEHAESLDRDTDGEFVHRAVLVPSEPEDELGPELARTIPAPAAAARRAG